MVKLDMTITSNSSMSGCHADATPWGFCLWRALDTTVHTPTHMAFSHEIIHTLIHMHTVRTRSMYSIAHTNAGTQYTGWNFTGKSDWQIKEFTHGDEPFRTFENLPKDVFLKTNYPCGCVKAMTTAASSSYQDSTDHRGFFFQAYVSYMQCSWLSKQLYQRKKLFPKYIFSQKVQVFKWQPIMQALSSNLQSCF